MSDQKIICRVCLQPKVRIKRLDKQYKWGFSIFVDEAGGQWNGRRCPDCSRYDKKMRRRAMGAVPIDQVQDHRFQVARRSERLVEAYYQSKGYSTKRTDGFGPDLICWNEKDKFSVEVKTVRKHQKTNSYSVHAVCEKRKNDDFIAYVFGEHVRVVPMSEHLLHVCKSGGRSVTKMLKAEGIL